MFNNHRKKLVFNIIGTALILGTLIVLGIFLSDESLISSFANKNLTPSWQHPFGTDWMGRDMLVRTIKGLRISLSVGFIGAFLGAGLATILGIIAGIGSNKVDEFIVWLVDLFMGLPHLIFIILISFMVGGGVKGVVLGVGLTHWPILTRLVRNEVRNIRHSEYIAISRNLGKSNFFIVRKHLLPHLLPQIIVGFLLLFPHAIIHEAAITFLGFGLSVQTPSIGLILSEAVKYISIGKWWLAVFPGLLLVIVIKSFDDIGEECRILANPFSANE
ncbi:MAG: ABC transporter permease [Acidaminococcaceae bacterium]|jgi:peptide/nickel transport system permease protein|nr:ABC transporter permease [Acidaminococcaceae bacterium]